MSECALPFFLPYSLWLHSRLAMVTSSWPAATTGEMASFILDRRNDDGGFDGRSAQSDLYYTAFALRTLAMLDRLDLHVADAAARYAQSCRPTNLIDLASILSIRWLGHAASGSASAPDGSTPPVPAKTASGFANASSFIESFRHHDGGYSLLPGAGRSSTYQTFLALLCCELAGRAPSRIREIREFVLQRRREDGGFAEVAALPRSSINATAAAVASLLILGEPGQSLTMAGEFLARSQRPDGGWPATAHAPRSDLLSTFTALTAIEAIGSAGAEYESVSRCNTATAVDLIHRCRTGSGGYGGVPGDILADVEYTFYAVGALALLDGRP